METTYQMTAQEHKAVASEILAQLGGRRFLAMTGSKNLIGLDNTPFGGLRLDFPMCSKANRLEIVVDADDTYTVRFYKFSPMRMVKSKGGIKIVDPKTTLHQEFTMVYCDMLQDLFTSVTGLYTRL